MSHLPSRSVRESSSDPNEYEVNIGEAEEEEDEEGMFEFDSDTEAQEYHRGHAALVAELSAKAVKAEADARSSVPGATNPNNAAVASTMPLEPSTDPAVIAAADPSKIATVVNVNIEPNADGEVNVALDVFQRFVPHLGEKTGKEEKEEAMQTTHASPPPPPASSTPSSTTTSSTATAATSTGAVASSSTSSSSNSSSSQRAAVSSKMVSSDSDDSDEESDDEDATGADLVLTGDLDKDHSTLSALMKEDAEMDGEQAEKEESSEDEDDEEDLALRAEAATLEDIGSDEEVEHVTGKTRGVFSKNEVKPAPTNEATPEFTVAPEMQIEEIGVYMSCLDRLLILSSTPTSLSNTAGKKVLDIGSAICTVDRKSVGRVEEVMGLVSEPSYAVRLCASFDVATMPDMLDDDADQNQVKMYFVPSLATFATPDNKPGTDASNLHDEEVPEEEQEFSDDEAEAEAKAERKAKAKAKLMEKKKADAIASGQQLPGARPIVTAKRKSGGQKPGQQNGNNSNTNTNTSNTTSNASQSTTAAPTQQTPYPYAPQGNALLPMPAGVAAPLPSPYFAQPFSMAPPQQGQQQQQQQHQQPYYPQQQFAAYHQQQAQAYAQYYAQNPQAAVYLQQQQQQPHPYYQQQHQQAYYPQQAYQPTAVPGGFAGWGAANLATAPPPQQQQQQQQHYAGYPQQQQVQGAPTPQPPAQ